VLLGHPQPWSGWLELLSAGFESRQVGGRPGPRLRVPSLSRIQALDRVCVPNSRAARPWPQPQKSAGSLLLHRHLGAAARQGSRPENRLVAHRFPVRRLTGGYAVVAGHCQALRWPGGLLVDEPTCRRHRRWDLPPQPCARAGPRRRNIDLAWLAPEAGQGRARALSPAAFALAGRDLAAAQALRWCPGCWAEGGPALGGRRIGSLDRADLGRCCCRPRGRCLESGLNTLKCQAAVSSRPSSCSGATGRTQGIRLSRPGLEVALLERQGLVQLLASELLRNGARRRSVPRGVSLRRRCECVPLVRRQPGRMPWNSALVESALCPVV